MTTSYDVGDKAVDPTTVTFMWRTPAGTETSYVYGVASEVARDAVGVYRFTAPIIAARGPHACRVKSTGAAVAAAEIVVTARRSEFTTP